jgi:hypothetical protein
MFPSSAFIPTQALKSAQPFQDDGHDDRQTDDGAPALLHQLQYLDSSCLAHRLGKDKPSKMLDRPSRLPP